MACTTPRPSIDHHERKGFAKWRSRKRKKREKRGRKGDDFRNRNWKMGPTPGFCVSVASKGVSFGVSLLFAALARRPIGVDSKEV